MAIEISNKFARLFFALWPDEITRSGLLMRAKQFKLNQARWVKAENFHMTLVFLGKVDVEKIPKLADLASKVRSKEFELQLDHVLCLYKSRMLWLTPGAIPVDLSKLVSFLSSSLTEQEFVLESRPFSPHLTLARKMNKKCRCQAVEPVEWRVKSFSLVESELSSSGANYRVLQSWNFAAI